MIKIIVATDEQRAIGRKGGLLCHLGGDMRHFREMTTGGAIVMGRKTWESFPRRPLPGRHNIVITRSNTYDAEGATVVNSLEDALAIAKAGTPDATENPHDIWIIGGGSVYKEAMEKNLADELEITEIHHAFDDADTWFPTLGAQWQEVSRERHDADEKNEYPYSFVRYVKK